MINQRLKEYVDSHLAKGYTEDQIRSHLMKSGWPKAELDSVFNVKHSQGPSDVSTKNAPVKRSSKKRIIIILAIFGVIISVMVILFMLLLSKNIFIGGKVSATPDVTPGSICIDDNTGCYNSVALYDNNISICERVSDDVQRSVCIATMKIGKLSDREYSVGSSDVFDSRAFFEQCNRTCISKGMEFKKNVRISLDDPILPVSVDTQFIYKNGTSVSIMSCYCY